MTFIVFRNLICWNREWWHHADVRPGACHSDAIHARMRGISDKTVQTHQLAELANRFLRRTISQHDQTKMIMSNLLKRKHQEETEFRANAEELKLSHNDLKPSSAELHFQQLLLSHIVARMANAMVSKESRLPSWWNLMLHKSWNLWCQCFRAGLTLKADCTQCNTEFATQKDPEEGVPRAISCSGASSPECEPKYTPHLITERVAKG